MDEKKLKNKQYYLENKEKILERSKKYYYDNIEIRKEYNRNYWELNKDKYLEQRSKSAEYKTKHRLYYHNYYKIRDEIPKDTKLKMKDIVVYNNPKQELTVYFN